MTDAVGLAILESLLRIETALSSGDSARTFRRGNQRADRLRTTQAGAKLHRSETTLRGHVARGLLLPIRPKGRGRGKPVYYRPDEVAALLVSEDAARELVAKRKLNRTR